MNFVPSMLLKQLYTRGSLRNASDGVVFSVKNRLSDAKLVALKKVEIGDKTFL